LGERRLPCREILPFSGKIFFCTRRRRGRGVKKLIIKNISASPRLRVNNNFFGSGLYGLRTGELFSLAYHCLIFVCLCIYGFQVHPGPGLFTTMDHRHAPSPVSYGLRTGELFSLAYHCLIFVCLCIYGFQVHPGPGLFITMDHRHAPIII
jgi:hypothetical protein